MSPTGIEQAINSEFPKVARTEIFDAQCNVSPISRTVAPVRLRLKVRPLNLAQSLGVNVDAGRVFAAATQLAAAISITTKTSNGR